ncbi:MAG: response regulator [Phycisphaerales bacterium]
MTRTPHTQDSTASEPHPLGAGGDHDLGQALVLIVDDNAQNVELLHAYLEELQCRLGTAADGLEALAAIDADPPDLILLDVMMPRMSGFQACSKIKSNPVTRDIPVVMVTALNEVGDIERAVESGADDFLTKPVNKIELLTRVRSLLRVRLLRKELDRTLGRLRDLERGAGKD